MKRKTPQKPANVIVKEMKVIINAPWKCGVLVKPEKKSQV